MSEAPEMQPVRLQLAGPHVTPPRRGDVSLVHPLGHEAGDSRIVLVLDVDRANEVADVALIHADPDLATDADVVVPKEVAGAHFPIVVQSDLRSAVWWSQLGARVGRLDAADLDRVNDALDPDVAVEPSPFEVGLPLEGPFDGRWEFKRVEGDDLRRLSADCSRALLEDDSDWTLDPRTIEPGQSADVLIELMHWLQTRTVRVSESAHEFAVEVYAKLTKDSWGEFADLATSIIDAFRDVILADPVSRAEGQRRALLTTAALETQTEEFDVVRYLGVQLELV